MSNHADLPQLNINARSPFHVYYEGAAKRITALNSVGPFDILPGHADFFSVLKPGEIAVETDADIITFHVTNGILAVHDGGVMLFVNM